MNISVPGFYIDELIKCEHSDKTCICQYMLSLLNITKYKYISLDEFLKNLIVR